MSLQATFVLRKGPCMMEFCNSLTTYIFWTSWGRTSFLTTNPSLLHVLVRLGLGDPWCIIQKSTLKAWVQWIKQKDIGYSSKIKSLYHQTADKSADLSNQHSLEAYKISLKSQLTRGCRGRISLLPAGCSNIQTQCIASTNNIINTSLVQKVLS